MLPNPRYCPRCGLLFVVACKCEVRDDPADHKEGGVVGGDGPDDDPELAPSG